MHIIINRATTNKIKFIIIIFTPAIKKIEFLLKVLAWVMFIKADVKARVIF